jgi:tetratricopeptide (TPR) repeat protein
MKIFIVLLSVCMILSYMPLGAQEIQGNILIDVGHSSQDIQNILGDLATFLRLDYYNVEFSKTIGYLDPYDVLVIAAPTTPYSVEEQEAIHEFVVEGGGLLLLGESGVLSSQNVEDFNNLSRYYGFEFQRDVVIDPDKNLVLDKPYPEIPIISNFSDHYVTRNISTIFFISGCSIRLSKMARPLAWGNEGTYGDILSEIYGFGGGTYEPLKEKKGENLILIAYTESGKGRIITIGDTSLFRGRTAAGSLWEKDPLEYFDHKRLAFNIFDWLSVKTKMGRVSELLDEGKALIEGGDYSEAQKVLEEVKEISQKTRDSFTMRQAFELLIKAENGLKANEIFETGKKTLEDINCEEASSYFKDALTLYEGLGNTEKVNECVALLAECGDTTAFLFNASVLLEEGRQLIDEGRYTEAARKITEARSIYEQFKIGERVTECDALLEKIQRNQTGEETEEIAQRNRKILAGLLLITTVIIIILILWRRSRPPKEFESPHPPGYPEQYR